jgi:hypothetical protein
MKKSLLPSVIFLVLAYALFVTWVSALDINTSVVSPTEQLPDINNTPSDAIASIIQFFILITGVLAVMVITWWGIGFIMSTGDDEKMKKSRKTIIYAFVGLVVAWLAYSIVEILTKAHITF